MFISAVYDKILIDRPGSTRRRADASITWRAASRTDRNALVNLVEHNRFGCGIPTQKSITTDRTGRDTTGFTGSELR